MKTGLIAAAEIQLQRAVAGARDAYVETRPLGADTLPFHDEWLLAHERLAAASRSLAQAADLRAADDYGPTVAEAHGAALALSHATARLIEDAGAASTLSLEERVDAAAEDLRAAARTFGLLLCALGDWKGAVPFVASIDAGAAPAAEGAE